ncbi:MAG: type VI secretion system tube protein Hcp [Desulfobacteraceae bacterium]|jgi:type VI secretion system secreted protein Hcp
MAFDAFIKIDGIEGESTDEKHAGWIEVTSYNTGLSQTVSSTASSAGGASAERADFHDFSITKQIDKASPKLAVACADGTHISSIVVELCRSGTDKVKFMEYKMTNCLISSTSTTGGGDFPTENVTIDFGKIEWSYTQQKRKGGGAAGNVASGWDLEKNCKV